MKTQSEMIGQAEELAASHDKLMMFIEELAQEIELFKLTLIKRDSSLPGDAFLHAIEAKKLIVKSKMPKKIEEEIIEAYEDLSAESPKGQSAHDLIKKSSEPIFVAVRSSATAEDLEDASFAGQQESFLNVRGEKELIEFVKKCFASLYTSRATFYRQEKGFKHEDSI